MALIGRPTKITPKIQETIVENLKAGNYIETAAAHAGIEKKTLYNWMKRAAREQQRVDDNPRAKIRKEEAPFVEFLHAVEKAQAFAEVRDVRLIAKAAEDHWQAAAWRLERKFPDKWGRKDKVSADLQHSGEVVERHEEDISITHRIEEYEDVYKQLANRSQVQGDHEGNSD